MPPRNSPSHSTDQPNTVTAPDSPSLSMPPWVTVLISQTQCCLIYTKKKKQQHIDIDITYIYQLWYATGTKTQPSRYDSKHNSAVSVSHSQSSSTVISKCKCKWGLAYKLNNYYLRTVQQVYPPVVQHSKFKIHLILTHECFINLSVLGNVSSYWHQWQL